MNAKLLTLLSVLSVLPSAGFGQSPYYNRDRGFGVGALVGALTGGAIGHNNGQTAEGALIGGAVGALAALPSAIPWTPISPAIMRSTNSVWPARCRKPRPSRM